MPPSNTEVTPETLTSPYGPAHGHIDEASGGADSSPFESMSSDEREEVRKANETDDHTHNAQPTPRG